MENIRLDKAIIFQRLIVLYPDEALNRVNKINEYVMGHINKGLVGRWQIGEVKLPAITSDEWVEHMRAVDEMLAMFGSKLMQCEDGTPLLEVLDDITFAVLCAASPDGDAMTILKSNPIGLGYGKIIKEEMLSYYYSVLSE